jgi:hypothetical protein
MGDEYDELKKEFEDSRYKIPDLNKVREPIEDDIKEFIIGIPNNEELWKLMDSFYLNKISLDNVKTQIRIKAYESIKLMIENRVSVKEELIKTLVLKYFKHSYPIGIIRKRVVRWLSKYFYEDSLNYFSYGQYMRYLGVDTKGFTKRLFELRYTKENDYLISKYIYEYKNHKDRCMHEQTSLLSIF